MNKDGDTKKMKLGCCIPGGNFLPAGSGTTAYELLRASCSAILDIGFDYAEASVGAAMKLDEITEPKLKIKYFNSFIPGDKKILHGSDGYAAALDYVKAASERLAQLGAEVVVFGSGAARMKPDGMEKSEADAVLARFCADAAEIFAGCGITLALEPLNRAETNMINSLASGAELVRRVNMPGFKLLCDAYHMFREGEAPEEASKYADILCHVHIAEPPERVYPGKNGGEYLKRLARTLTEIGYTGGVSAECSYISDIRAEVSLGCDFMKDTFGFNAQ